MSDPRIDRIAARWSAAQTVARVTVDDLLADLPDDTYDNAVALFPDWTTGETVAVGAVRQFDSNLWPQWAGSPSIEAFANRSVAGWRTTSQATGAGEQPATPTTTQSASSVRVWMRRSA